jgi:NAD(P)-dependent dehydrogenase (short-subunit alcohol dehydrogenase family)
MTPATTSAAISSPGREVGMRLEDKVAVITGAGSGMGRAMAELFAREGAKVVAGEIVRERLDTLVHEVRARNGEITGLAGDIGRRADAEALVQAAIDTYGALDVLVNNAGVMDLFEGAATFTEETYERVMAINVYGPLVTSRASVRFMKEHGGGAIVNVASAAGVGGGAAGVVYTASKHALIGITRNTAFTDAPQGVRCNAIIVGGVATNIMADADMSRADGEALAQYGKWHAVMPATLQPEDIANVALFLSSDEATRINGALVNADGGWGAA